MNRVREPGAALPQDPGEGEHSLTVLRMEYVKNGAAVRITTEESTFVLDAAEAVTLHLFVGLEVTPEIALLFYERAGSYDAMTKALGSLARVDFSKEGLVRRLKEKQVEERFAREAADYFEEAGYLNDVRYAEKLAVYYLEEKGWGMKRAANEMVSKGLSRETAQEALSALEQDPRDNIRALLARKYPRAELADRKVKKRVCDALFRYGFAYEDIAAVLQERSAECDEMDPSI